MQICLNILYRNWVIGEIKNISEQGVKSCKFPWGWSIFFMCSYYNNVRSMKMRINDV